MRSRCWSIAFLACALLTQVGCRTGAGVLPVPPEQEAAASQPVPPIRITIVATNDVHGWVQPYRYTSADGTSIAHGGLAAFGGYVKVLRQHNPGGVILLDAGDLFQGTLASNLTEGAVVIDAFNHLGYTAAAIGNHEFDYGPEGPISVASRPGLDPFGALKARIRQAQFPLLAANIYDAATGDQPEWIDNQGLLLVEVKGVKVGIVGLITPTTPSVTNPVNVSSLRFGSLAPEIEMAGRALRNRGAELVIGLAHAGGKCGAHADPHDLTRCDLATGEIFEALQSLPPRTLDAVVAGHTHAVIGHFVQGTPVVESWGLGRYFSTIDLYVDPKKRTVLEERTAIGAAIPICAEVDQRTQSCESRLLKEATQVSLVPATFLGQPIEVDQELERRLAPALAKVEAEQRRPLGLSVPLTLGRHYEAESALGSFLADSLRAMEKADVALLNSGGLRADLKAGEVSYGAIYEVLPFDNTVATVSLTGAELGRLLHAAFTARKGVFQVSGLRLKLSRCPGHGRLRSFALSDGRPLQSDRRYRVVMPDFLARGGDGLEGVLGSLPAGRVDLGEARELNFRDALIAFWQGRRSRSLVAPPLGRTVFVDDGSQCSVGAKLDGQTGVP